MCIRLVDMNTLFLFMMITRIIQQVLQKYTLIPLHKQYEPTFLLFNGIDPIAELLSHLAILVPLLDDIENNTNICAASGLGKNKFKPAT